VTTSWLSEGLFVSPAVAGLRVLGLGGLRTGARGFALAGGPTGSMDPCGAVATADTVAETERSGFAVTTRGRSTARGS
jgi:hypothetical protein